jgi:2'-5' RNA ligase
MTVRRAIVAFPRVETPDAWARVLGFRDRHDPLARSIPAHVTLVFPFEDPLSDEALEGHARDAVRGLAPIRLALRGVTAHEGEYLFLGVKQGNDAVVALRDALHRGVLTPHRSRLHTFVPHVTIGRVGPADLPRALADSAALDAVEVTAWLDRVST